MSKRMVDVKTVNGKVVSIDGYGVGGTAVEANPQDEATQQLEKIKIDNITYSAPGGGSGGNNIAVTKVETREIFSGTVTQNKWVSDRKLKPNTAYNVGDIVAVTLTTVSQPVHVESNQILVLCPGYTNSSYERYKFQFGDVVVMLVEDTYNTEWSSANGEDYTLVTTHEIAYAVIKGGTTGTSTEISSSGWNFKYKLALYTVGSGTK